MEEKAENTVAAIQIQNLVGLTAEYFTHTVLPLHCRLLDYLQTTCIPRKERTAACRNMTSHTRVSRRQVTQYRHPCDCLVKGVEINSFHSNNQCVTGSQTMVMQQRVAQHCRNVFSHALSLSTSQF